MRRGVKEKRKQVQRAINRHLRVTQAIRKEAQRLLEVKRNNISINTNNPL